MSVVVDIDGLDYLTSTTIGRALEYGDPYNYGDAGLLYGMLVPIGIKVGERGQRQLLEMSGSTLSIQQTLEPESGRASISTMTMNFVDKDSYITRAVSSGPILPEILGQQVKIWFGYANTQFPNDYFVLWRGRIGQVNAGVGKVSMQFLDPNVVRRQDIFYTAQTTLNGNINGSVTTIPVINNASFHKKLTGPDGTYDTTVRTFLKIDNEFIEYQNSGNEATGFGTNQFLNCVRGALPTGINSPGGAASHTTGATVDSYVMLTGNIMDLSLKIMMSGWNGPYLSSQALQSLNITGDAVIPNLPSGIILPTNIDAVRDLGISVGDYFTTSGSAIGGNNISGKVLGFQDLVGQTNRGILTDQTFTIENPTAAVLAIRSQYDVYPDSCGSQLPGWEVDVTQFKFLKNSYLSAAGYTFQILINSSDAAKTFIENQLLMPVGAYSLTRQGKISVGLTKPKLADANMQILSVDNVIDPKNITVQRGVNNRKFFNEIDWQYDYGDDGNAASVRNTLNAASLNAIGISSVMPIDTQGAKTSQGFENVVAQRENWLFSRYARGSVLINLQTTLGVGALIECGDIVEINDNGHLQIPNFTTGIRNLGSQLFEVIKRDINLMTGITSLTLEGGTGAQVTDRFATISPSSFLGSAATTGEIIILESFGNLASEQKKWAPYVGLNVRVHSLTYSRDGTTTFTGFDPSNDHGMMLSPPLAFAPSAGDQVDICQYPDDTNALNQALYKLVHCFIDKSPNLVSGVSHYSFYVSSGDAGHFQVEFPIQVHDISYSHNSSETTIVSVTGNLIVVEADLGFTPNNSMTGEYLGFLDAGQPYRLI